MPQAQNEPSAVPRDSANVASPQLLSVLTPLLFQWLLGQPSSDMDSKHWKAPKPATADYGLHVFINKDKEGLNLVDIVAIHGLNGHYVNTWTTALEDGSQVNWLRDLLPKEVPNARIMSFSYNSTVLFSKSTSDISPLQISYWNILVQGGKVGRSQGLLYSSVIALAG
jgi:hypothetical protein